MVISVTVSTTAVQPLPASVLQQENRKLEIPRLSVNNPESSYTIREQAATDTLL